MKYLLVVVILLSACNEKLLYTNAYNHIVDNYSKELLSYLQEESSTKSFQELQIHISQQIVPLKPVFFDNQIDEMKDWEIFSDVDNIRSYLWNYNLKPSGSSNLMKLDTVNEELHSSNLVMFFSEESEGLLLAEIIWLPPSINNDTSYESMTNVGRSIRFLLEIDSNNRVLNSVSTYVHNN